MGNGFLRHAARTRLLIYLLDAASPTVASDFRILDEEMASYKELSKKAKIIAVNKIDLPEVAARLPQLRIQFAGLGLPVFYISALTGQAVVELAAKAMELADQAGRNAEAISEPQIGVFHPKPRK
jgi:GTP-binding protein